MNDPNGPGVRVRRRRTRRHRRNRFIRRSLLAVVFLLGGLTGAALLPIDFGSFLASSFSSHPAPEWSNSSDVRRDLALSAAASDAPSKDDRPVYPYSIVPGGVVADRPGASGGCRDHRGDALDRHGGSGNPAALPGRRLLQRHLGQRRGRRNQADTVPPALPQISSEHRPASAGQRRTAPAAGRCHCDCRGGHRPGPDGESCRPEPGDADASPDHSAAADHAASAA